MYDIFDQHVRVSPKPPDELEPSIPAAVAAYVLRAIEKEPDHRFQSAEEFAAALRALPASDGPVRLATPVRARPRVDPVARVEAAAPTVTERSPAATERTGRPRRIAELTGLTAIGVFASAMLLRHLVSSPEPGIAVAPLELQALGPVAAGIAARGSLPLPRVEEPPRLAYDEAREDARKERIDAEERSVHRAARRPPKASNRRRPALSRDHHPAADTPPAVERRPLAEPPVAPTPVLAREAPEAPEVARTPPGAGPSDVEVVAALEKRVVDQCAGLDPGAKVWVEVEVTLDGRAYPEIHNVNPAARRCVRDVVRQANFQKGVSRAVEFTLVLR